MDTPNDKEISRYGAYGIIIQNSKLLLTQKKSGPYKNLWGLPGGCIEFGETPEISLIREIKEETALLAQGFELFTVITNCCDYLDKKFHHIGIIYKVDSVSELSDVIPEEKKRWVNIKEITPEELTPFAKHVWLNLKNFGVLKGKVKVAKNFDDPLPDDLLDEFDCKS